VYLPGSVFTGNADLLGSLRHLGGVVMNDLVVVEIVVGLL
jgi:hypothetical protein